MDQNIIQLYFCLKIIINRKDFFLPSLIFPILFLDFEEIFQVTQIDKKQLHDLHCHLSLLLYVRDTPSYEDR